MTIAEIKDRLQVILIWKKNKFWFRVLDMGTSGHGSEGFSKTIGKDEDRDLLYEIRQEMMDEESNNKFIAMYEYFDKLLSIYKEAYEKALLDKNGKVK